VQRSIESLLKLYLSENRWIKHQRFHRPGIRYADARLENEQVFAHNWQVAGRVDRSR